MSEIKDEVFKGKFFLNINLHVTILFTILSIFFILYIKKITSNAINNEMTSIINSYFDNVKKNNKGIDKYNNIKKEYDDLVFNAQQNINSVYYDKILEAIKLKESQLNLLNFVHLDKKNIPNVSQNLNSYSNFKDVIESLKGNFDYNYYVNIYSQENFARKLVNQEVINKIIHVNILLILITIVFTVFLYFSKNVTIHDIQHVLIENMLTFSMVGVVEFLFFTKISLNYIPAPPSLIFNSLLGGLQDKFSGKVQVKT